MNPSGGANRQEVYAGGRHVATYAYDGLGNRVSKSNGKLYWYGMGSAVLDESDLSGNITNEYVYFGGQRIARRDASGNVYYYVEDMLGTSRALTTANGTVCYDADFYPFGGERTPVVNTCPQNFKFNGKERDPETGLDDFGARYFSSSFGRWLSPDWSAIPAPVPYADLTNPQTLNLYQFVKNDPETFSDLDGHEPGWMYQEACKDCGGWNPENATNLLSVIASYTVIYAHLSAPPNPTPSQDHPTQKQTPAGLAAQVPREVKAAIAASVDASNSSSAVAGDKTGGFHEEGGIWGTDTSGKAVPVPAVAGPVSDPRADTAAHIDVANSANPSLKENLASIGGKWHVHPSGSITEDNRKYSFTQPPSKDDKTTGSFPINIVVGARNKRVYFYNSSGVIGKPMKLKDFLKNGDQ
jgi:RHS repeat-associated protein